MRIAFYAIVWLTILAGLSPALAQAATDADVCMSTAQSQSAMNRCAGQQFRASDTRLNNQYRELKQRLKASPDQQALLLTAQRRWLAYRDAECAFNASSVAGGSAQPMVRLLCMTQATDQRNKTLDYYLHCSEGDLSCPAPYANKH